MFILCTYVFYIDVIRMYIAMYKKIFLSYVYNIYKYHPRQQCRNHRIADLTQYRKNQNLPESVVAFSNLSICTSSNTYIVYTDYYHYPHHYLVTYVQLQLKEMFY